MYRAEDGTLFENEYDCSAYEVKNLIGKYANADVVMFEGNYQHGWAEITFQDIVDDANLVNEITAILFKKATPESEQLLQDFFYDVLEEGWSPLDDADVPPQEDGTVLAYDEDADRWINLTAKISEMKSIVQHITRKGRKGGKD